MASATAEKKAPAKPAKTAAKKVAAPKAEKAPKVERAQSNGITKPKDGSTTGRIWDIADSISKKKGSPATRAEVLEQTGKEEINEATVATQYQRWRTYFGVKAAPKAAKAAPAPKAPKAPAKKAAKKTAAATE